MIPIRRILYSTDFSSYSNQAYFHAVTLAESHKAELVILHCYDDTSIHGESYWREQLEQIRPTNERIPVRHVLVKGNPAEEIVHYAYEADINMIVMGTHGNSGEDSTILGSTAMRVLRDAPCSVLVIKLPKAVRPNRIWEVVSALA